MCLVDVSYYTKRTAHVSIKGSISDCHLRFITRCAEHVSKLIRKRHKIKSSNPRLHILFRNICLAAFECRIIIVGFAGGKIQRIPANILLVKNITVIGYYWGAYATRGLRLLRESFADLAQMYAPGKLRPLVGATFPLEDAAKALAHLADRKAIGKTIITMGRENNAL